MFNHIGAEHNLCFIFESIDVALVPFVASKDTVGMRGKHWSEVIGKQLLAIGGLTSADKFKREAPLNNCRSLMSELDAVKQKAKEKLAHNIISDCNKAASGRGSIDAARARIHEYVHAFGGERQFAEAKSKLNDAERHGKVKNNDNSQRHSSDRHSRSSSREAQHSSSSHTTSNNGVVRQSQTNENNSQSNDEPNNENSNKKKRILEY